MTRLIIYVCAALTLWTTESAAQLAIPVGTWRAHVPYRYSIAMHHSGDFMYLTTERGLIIENKNNGSRQYLSHIDGLAGSIIAHAAYNESQRTHVIAYTNGNIDLIKNNEIVTLTDIARYEAVGGKNIYNVYCDRQFAYFSCDFGVVVLDVQREEVSESWLNLRRNSAGMSILQTAIYNDTIFLMGNLGLIYCPAAASVNKADRNSWKTYNLPFGDRPLMMHVSQNALLFFLNTGRMYKMEQDTGYYLEASIQSPVSEVYSLYEHNNAIYVGIKQAILEYNASQQRFDTLTTGVDRPVSIYRDGNGTFWIADYYMSLVRYKNGDLQYTWPIGPIYNTIFAMGNVQGITTLFAGGRTSGFAPFFNYAGWITFDNNVWFTRFSDPLLSDMIGSVHNSVTGKSYIISYGEGFLEVSPNGSNRVLNDKTEGVPFVSQYASSTHHRSTDAFVEPSGKTWFTIHAFENRISPSLYALNTNGTWESYVMGSEDEMQYPYKMVVDVYGNKWVSCRYTQSRNALYVYNEKATGQKFRKLLEMEGQGNLRDVLVNALRLDNNNDIWIGTAKGISVMPANVNALTANNYDTYWPVVNGRPLLENEYITDIEIDGGNRKWIGSRNGLWLLSPDGKEIVYQFKSDNSPLPSNNIIDVYIDQTTSEVFIVTDMGLVSFRGTATGAQKTFGTVRVFPNPAACCDSPVSITGLVQNAVYKITDVTGRLIYEGKANGGMAVWNMHSFAGGRAVPGIYLVFAASEDGEEALVSKFAITE